MSAEHLLDNDLDAACTPPCIACQAGLAIACIETERRIRADERHQLRRALTTAINDHQLLALTHALEEPKMRRTAGLLVHTLTTILEATA